MRAQVFVPGHISCTFRPVMGPDTDRTGSLGIGIRLSLGCRATVSLRDDDHINININGEPSDAAVTRYALESMFPGRGMDVSLDHDLPLEQGFGSSASGTYAATLAAAALTDMDSLEAAKATHRAEFKMGGGLGDLLAIYSGYGVPIRTSPGAPGVSGKTEDSGISLNCLSLAVFDQPLKTESVLKDEVMMKRIMAAGDRAMEDFSKERSVNNLFKVSNRFSEEIGLESEDVSWAIQELKDIGYNAGMCMLGNSIYTDAPPHVLRDAVEEADVFGAASYDGILTVIRTE